MANAYILHVHFPPRFEVHGFSVDTLQFVELVSSSMATHGK